jgi:hypothetical protein
MKTQLTIRVRWTGGSRFMGTDRELYAVTNSVACAFQLAETPMPRGYDRLTVMKRIGDSHYQQLAIRKIRQPLKVSENGMVELAKELAK